MTAPRTNYIPSLSLLALCLALGAVVYHQLDVGDARVERGQEMRSPGVAAPSRAGVVQPTDFKLPPLESLSETVERPLFRSTRRPLEPVAKVVEESPEPEKLNILLSGVVITAKEKFAHIRERDDARAKTLSEGDRIGIWRLKAILPDRVILESGERTEEILLKAAPPAATKLRGTQSNRKRRNTRSRRRRNQE